jgi:hypothetical protein
MNAKVGEKNVGKKSMFGLSMSKIFLTPSSTVDIAVYPCKVEDRYRS